MICAVVFFLVIGAILGSSPYQCKLGVLSFSDSTYCKDFVCSDENALESIGNFSHFCDFLVRIELAFIKSDQSSSSLQIWLDFLDLDENVIQKALNSTTGIEVFEIDIKAASRDGPYFLLMTLRRYQLENLISLSQNNSSAFLGDLANFLHYSDYNFRPCVHNLLVITSNPSENETLTLESVFMSVPGFPKSGTFWTSEGIGLSESYEEIEPLGFDFYRSVLSIPGANVIPDLSGTFRITVWHESSSYFANSRTVQVQIKAIPQLIFDISSLIFIRHESDQPYCCNVIDGTPVSENNTRIIFDPLFEKVTSVNQISAVNQSFCLNFTFSEVYEGEIRCVHDYWGGYVSKSNEIKVVAPLETFFCPSNIDFFITWPETLSYPNRSVLVSKTCPESYIGVSVRSCGRSLQNVGIWQTANYVDCFSPHIMQIECFNPQTLVSNASLVIVCLNQISEFLRQHSTKPGDVGIIFQFLTNLNAFTANSITTVHNLNYALSFFEAYINVVRRVLEVADNFVWSQLEEFSSFSYYTSIELLNDFSRYFLESWPAFNLTEVANRDSNYVFSIFQLENINSSIIEIVDGRLKVEFTTFSEGLMVYFDQTGLSNNFKLFDENENLMPFLLFKISDSDGIFRISFEKVPEYSENLPICVQLNSSLHWVEHNCESFFGDEFYHCECHNSDLSIYGVKIGEKVQNKVETVQVPTWLQIFQIVCCILAIFGFSAAFYILLFRLKPRTGRTFIFCQLGGAQIIALFIYILFFKSEMQISPTFCAIISTIFKFLTVYSFLWISYEAKYSKLRTKKKMLKLCGEEFEGVEKLLNPSRVFRVYMLVILVISITISIGSEILKFFFDPDYPPEFLESVCHVRGNQAMTHFGALVVPILISVIRYIMLLFSIRKHLCEPKFDKVRQAAYAIARVSIKWMFCVLYPCLFLIHGLHFLTFFTPSDLLTSAWSVLLVLQPIIIIGYVNHLNRKSKRYKKKFQRGQEFTSIEQQTSPEDYQLSDEILQAKVINPTGVSYSESNRDDEQKSVESATHNDEKSQQPESSTVAEIHDSVDSSTGKNIGNITEENLTISEVS